MRNNDINKYHQKIALKEKILLINKFNKNLESNLIDKFNLLRIDYPIVFNDNSIFISKAKNERTLTFDSFNKDNLFYCYPDLSIWLKNKLLDLDINTDQGLLIFNKKINRDKDNYESLVSNYLTIEYRINEQQKTNKEFYNQILFDLIKIIKISLNGVIEKKDINQCQLLNENRIKIVNFNDIKKKFLSKKDIIDIYIPKYGYVLIKEISSLYVDDHSIFNPFKEEENTTMKLFYLNKINKNISLICSIYTRPNYETLINQCNLSNFDISKIEKYKDIYSKQSICIELNLSNLYSCIFEEFSNCESTNSCEKEDLYNIYKLKKIKVM